MMIKRCVNHIVAAARRFVAGDFSVRVKPISKWGVDESFNEIIDCFNQMAQELSGVEILRTDFISNVSHEMKQTGKSENLSKCERVWFKGTVM